MHADLIDDYAGFLRLKEQWDTVYAADPDARFFMSWTWMSKWLESAIHEWVVIGIREAEEADDYLAFLPLRFQSSAAKSGRIHTEIRLAAYGIADYTGFLCKAGAEHDAIPALAEQVEQLNWGSFDLGCFHASEERLKLWRRAFPRPTFKFKKPPSAVDSNGNDTAICPYATLPDNWDDYLDNQLSANTRQKVRRFLRKVENDDAYRITVSNADTIEADHDHLAKLWEARWGAMVGQTGRDIFYRIRTKMVLHTLSQDALFMPMLWHHDKPVGGLITFVDHQKKAMFFYLAGRDMKAKGVPIGLVLHAYSIRHAIDQGFTTYDFMRGDEAYKYSFANKERRVVYDIIERRTSGKQFDPRSVRSALLSAETMMQMRRLPQAERAYRQIVAAAPDNERARLGLGQVLMAQGKRAAAEEYLAGPPSETSILSA